MPKRTSPVNQPKRDTLIRAWAKEIKAQLDHLLPNKSTEADLRFCVAPLLDNFCREVGVPPMTHAEYSMASGIADAVFDRFIIEYKRPSVLSPRVDLQTSSALDQLKGYLRDIAKDRDKSEHLGGPSFSELAGADSDLLLRRLKDMEEGGIFRAFGISNLLEGDFFSWYLHAPAWGNEMESAVRDLLKLLNEYEPTTLSIRREETRDLFKKLYHYLLPREIRHALGEYYTPDWLAQRLLNQIDNEYFTADPRRKAKVTVVLVDSSETASILV